MSCAGQDAVDVDEIRGIAKRHPSLRVHEVDADSDGRLTPEAVMHDAAQALNPWIYMCGPPVMMKAFSAGFRKLGVPASRIRWEQFDVR